MVEREGGRFGATLKHDSDDGGEMEVANKIPGVLYEVKLRVFRDVIRFV